MASAHAQHRGHAGQEPSPCSDALARAPNPARAQASVWLLVPSVMYRHDSRIFDRCPLRGSAGVTRCATRTRPDPTTGPRRLNCWQPWCFGGVAGRIRSRFHYETTATRPRRWLPIRPAPLVIGTWSHGVERYSLSWFREIIQRVAGTLR